MKNHFDKNGNYINVENLSLAEIYHRGYQDGSEDGLNGIRPQGKWIITDCERDILHPNGKKYTCPVCRRDNSYGKPPFCMWCGADMRGGGEDHD